MKSSAKINLLAYAVCVIGIVIIVIDKNYFSHQYPTGFQWLVSCTVVIIYFWLTFVSQIKEEKENTVKPNNKNPMEPTGKTKIVNNTEVPDNTPDAPEVKAREEETGEKKVTIAGTPTPLKNGAHQDPNAHLAAVHEITDEKLEEAIEKASEEAEATEIKDPNAHLAQIHEITEDKIKDAQENATTPLAIEEKKGDPNAHLSSQVNMQKDKKRRF